MSPRPCPLIARALEKYADKVEVDKYLPGEEDPDVDCVVNAYAPEWTGDRKFASMYFVQGELGDGDVQVSEPQLHDVRHVLKTLAKTCKLTEIHEHPEYGDEAAFHLHLRKCNIRDLGRVLEAGGYKG